MTIKRLDETRKDGQVLAYWLRGKLLSSGYAGKRCGDIRDVAMLVYFGGDGHGDDIARLQSAVRARSVRELAIDRDEVASVAEIEAELDNHECGLALVYHFDRALLVDADRCHAIVLSEGDSCVGLVTEELRKVIEYAKREADKRD